MLGHQYGGRAGGVQFLHREEEEAQCPAAARAQLGQLIAGGGHGHGAQADDEALFLACGCRGKGARAGTPNGTVVRFERPAR
ncbi:hypothetical protein ADL12_00010 [Streptomyces regalis]|uniref:Uncharacterized protein n=1 Tax=Streptomyces regalis TaxID=68262 RepID=A0A0X3VQB3_9ACTN|nr:hypothetical protein ADL12_00010 [Streptomyces regalis]